MSNHKKPKDVPKTPDVTFQGGRNMQWPTEDTGLALAEELGIQQPIPKHVPFPTVGRIVHYFQKTDVPMAAIVTRVVDKDLVSLAVLNPDSGFTQFKENIPYCEKPRSGNWTWPAKV